MLGSDLERSPTEGSNLNQYTNVIIQCIMLICLKSSDYLNGGKQTSSTRNISEGRDKNVQSKVSMLAEPVN